MLVVKQCFRVLLHDRGSDSERSKKLGDGQFHCVASLETGSSTASLR
jgi:hypothetical protein